MAADGALTLTSDPVPPLPAELAAWIEEEGAELPVSGRLLE
jgi:hypothetical protein